MKLVRKHCFFGKYYHEVLCLCMKKMFIPPELLILCSVGVLLVNSTQCGRCGPKESRREEMILHKIM